MDRHGKYRCFLTDRGEDEIDGGLRSLGITGRARGRLGRVLDLLKCLSKTDWKKPRAASTGDNVYVIHSQTENSQQIRIFGSFLDSHSVFAMTVVATEKDREYIPANAKATAAQRRDVAFAAIEDRTRRCFPNTEPRASSSADPLGVGGPAARIGTDRPARLQRSDLPIALPGPSERTS